MSTFDKVLHLVGVMATGALATALSMGAALPVWAAVALGSVAAGAQLATPQLIGKKPPAAP